MTKSLYLIGSLRNERIPKLASKLRRMCPDVEVFDDWYAAGPEADDFWKDYEKAKGSSYEAALRGYAAKHVFDFDRYHLNRCSHALLVLPAGKSGHMEIMYAQYGSGSRTAILLDPDDVRWDVMYQFIPTIVRSEAEVVDWLKREESEIVIESQKPTASSPGLTTRGRQREAAISNGGWPSRLFS